MLLLAACSTGPQPAPRASEAPGECPQERRTPRAPGRYRTLENPLPMTAETLERGRRLYEREASPRCAECHGLDGDGRGPAAQGLAPPPRNFRCAQTMSGIPDGQLFWVIQEGAGPYHRAARQGAQEVERPGRGTFPSGMGGYGDSLSETAIWQLVAYVRSLAAPGASGAPSRDAPAPSQGAGPEQRPRR
jgi:mono/diheme cytochrome c family protein